MGNETINELFDWTGLWGASWDASMLMDGLYEVRAIAKDWSGNVTPEDMAPILTIEVANGVVNPETPGADVSIEFTANIGGVGIGDKPYDNDSYRDIPGMVITVEAPEPPTVLVLAEFDSPVGLVFGGEVVDVKAEEGVSGRYSAAIKGDEFMRSIITQGWYGIDTFMDLIRLGGRITVYATTPACPGIGMATLTMDDLTVYPVTAELGTNGTVYSKDGAVSVMVPRAALYEPVSDGVTLVEQAGLMITPTITPNTRREQRLILEPVGQAYSIELFDYLENLYQGFREGFEPTITISYADMGLPAADEALGFISVRYWNFLTICFLKP